MDFKKSDVALAYLTLICGLTISAVAIWYSVAGLVAIFAAAAIPIIIMGVALEVSKLVATVWLKWNWKRAPWLIKTYLIIAVVVLMFITSMGIFGFLSKAHIDQAASSIDSVARVEQITKEVARQNEIIERAEQRLKRIETSGVGADSNVQSQIDAEQARIDSAYNRIQPAIDEQQRIIDSQIKLLQDELTKIDQELATLQGYIDSNDIRKAQAMVGARVDGQFGPATAASFQNWQARKSQDRNGIIARIESANTNPTVRAARNEIQRLRRGVESQISESNKLVNRLRSQLGQADTNEIERQMNEQRSIITTSTAEVDSLTRQKYELEAETRKLEAEVGPIKFIADFIYGDRADKNTLEEAVRWMILIIVLVFDPLAVVLLLASQSSFQWLREQKKEQLLTEEQELPLEPEPDETDYVPGPWPFMVDEEKELEPEKQEPVLSKEYISGDVTASEKFGLDKIESLSIEPLEELKEEPITVAEEIIEEEIPDDVPPAEKAAMKRWKDEHPDDSLKHQRRLFELKIIDRLPWHEYLEAKPDYVQNEEQNSTTIWQKLKNIKK